jgi:hypothetical protein
LKKASLEVSLSAAVISTNDVNSNFMFWQWFVTLWLAVSCVRVRAPKAWSPSPTLQAWLGGGPVNPHFKPLTLMMPKIHAFTWSVHAMPSGLAQLGQTWIELELMMPWWRPPHLNHAATLASGLEGPWHTQLVRASEWPTWTWMAHCANTVAQSPTSESFKEVASTWSSSPQRAMWACTAVPLPRCFWATHGSLRHCSMPVARSEDWQTVQLEGEIRVCLSFQEWQDVFLFWGRGLAGGLTKETSNCQSEAFSTLLCSNNLTLGG